ncbi:hypothetical protein VB711_07605 [Cronbergia sp. UHCC 0137]|uniref:hypothetical protein n=1 Tax=Cronbergia sp. UHCC 0137 TaxID=3110239 RepID=UPI002B1EB280|nr:hypothetical protein [Cronbergia sp. UHCC 0137]MEA5617701.1 hypothetical protein [Cronbergia sp. UHCC 0137]
MSDQKAVQKLNFNSPWFIIFVFSILGVVAILNHSMWRDELNPWLIVRDSESWGDFIGNIRYEGHPVLWYFSLAILRNIADTPMIMQLFHLGLAINSVAIFWLYSPFDNKQKLLFTFGYLPFYEYFLISRNYAFGMLFIFAFCAAFESRKKTYLILSVLLGLMANSNAYALLISFALLLTLIVEFCFDIEHRNQYFNQNKKYDLWLSIAIIVFCYILAISIITPPADSYLHGGLSSGWSIKFDIAHLLKTIGKLFAGYFLIIPESKRWLDLIVCTLISLFIISLILLKLGKKPFATFFYIFGNLELLAFAYFKFSGSGPRHFGHFYLILLAALWLGSYDQESSFLTNKLRFYKNSAKFVQKWQHITLMAILYIQFFGGIYGFGRDLIIPFSASRETSQYIQKAQINNEFIVASRDANMAALSGYLNQKFYYPELGGMGSFTLFKKGRKDVDQDEILRQVSSILIQPKSPNRILLILHQKLKSNRNDLKIINIKNFERAWVDTERYYLYWVYKDSIKTAKISPPIQELRL